MNPETEKKELTVEVIKKNKSRDTLYLAAEMALARLNSGPTFTKKEFLKRKKRNKQAKMSRKRNR